MIKITMFTALLVCSSSLIAATPPKITMAKARVIALTKVPRGTIESGELEREHGKLIYSFDIRTSKPGVTEVQVDANTGQIVSVKHETPAHEAAEKKMEAKKKKN